MDVENISLSGALITFDKLDQYPWFRVDQTLEIDFFEWEELTNIRVTGRIVRMVEDRQKPGFGVEFHEMSDDAIQALRGLLARATGESSTAPAAADPPAAVPVDDPDPTS